jgi:hypothetical protein
VTERRADLVAALGLSAVLLAVYVGTAPRTVTLEDSGLFLVTTESGGIAHPPGYPLYVLLAHGFTSLPLGTVAFRVSLLSALCGAGTAVALFACARLLGASRPASSLAALAFGFSGTFWSQAVVAEVYALHTLLLFTLLALCLRLAARFSLSRLCAASFVAGLALANHWQLTALTAPAFLAALWPERSRILRRLPAAAACLGLGLLPYLHFFAVDGSVQVTAFGPVRSLDDLWWYVSLGPYRSALATQPGTFLDLLAFLGDFFERLSWEFSPVGYGCAVAGLAWLALRGSTRTLLVIVLGILSSSLLFRLISWDVHSQLSSEQYLTVQVGSFGFGALAMAFAEGWVGRARADAARYRNRFVWLVGGGVVVLTVALHLEANDRRHERFAADYGRLVLESLPPGAALLLSQSTDTGPVAYMHRVEGVRPDVTLYSQVGAIFPNRLFEPRQAPDEQTARLASFIDEQESVFFTFASPVLLAARRELNVDEVPGLVNRIAPDASPFVPAPRILDELERMLDRELAGENTPHWPFHRERILASACVTLIRAGRQHDALTGLPYCAFAYGSHLHREGRLAEARGILHRLLTESPADALSPGQRHLAHLYHLDATLALAERGDRLPLQEAVDLARQGLLLGPGCGNRIATLLARVHRASEGRIDVGLPTLSRHWGACPAVREALDAASLSPVDRSP